MFENALLGWFEVDIYDMVKSRRYALERESAVKPLKQFQLDWVMYYDNVACHYRSHDSIYLRLQNLAVEGQFEVTIPPEPIARHLQGLRPVTYRVSPSTVKNVCRKKYL
jgi:hypothetical protein